MWLIGNPMSPLLNSMHWARREAYWAASHTETSTEIPEANKSSRIAHSTTTLRPSLWFWNYVKRKMWTDLFERGRKSVKSSTHATPHQRPTHDSVSNAGRIYDAQYGWAISPYPIRHTIHRCKQIGIEFRVADGALNQNCFSFQFCCFNIGDWNFFISIFPTCTCRYTRSFIRSFIFVPYWRKRSKQEEEKTRKEKYKDFFLSFSKWKPSWCVH